MLAEAYPGLIDGAPGNWVGSKAGGILGKVHFLYFSPREYVVIFGSPTGTQGFSGRYQRVEIHKFLLAGQIDSYDVESDALLPLPPLQIAGQIDSYRCARSRDGWSAPGRVLSSRRAHLPRESTAVAQSFPRCLSRWSTRCSCPWRSNLSADRVLNSQSWSQDGSGDDALVEMIAATWPACAAWPHRSPAASTETLVRGSTDDR